MVSRVCLQRVIRWLSLIKGFLCAAETLLAGFSFIAPSLYTARASNIITSANIVFFWPMADAWASKLMKQKQGELSLWLRQGRVASVLYIKLIRNPETWGFVRFSWFIWPHFIDEIRAEGAPSRLTKQGFRLRGQSLTFSALKNSSILCRNSRRLIFVKARFLTWIDVLQADDIANFSLWTHCLWKIQSGTERKDW